MMRFIIYYNDFPVLLKCKIKFLCRYEICGASRAV